MEDMKKLYFALIGAVIRLTITIACWIFVIIHKEFSIKQAVIIILVYVEIAALDLGSIIKRQFKKYEKNRP